MTAHVELQHDATRLGKLHRLTLRLAATPDMREALLHVLDTAVEGQRAQYGLVSLFDDTDGFLHLWASIGFGAEALGALRDVAPGAGACGHSFSTKTRVIVEETEADPLFTNFVGVARRVGFRAVHNTPILTRAGEIRVLIADDNAVRRAYVRAIVAAQGGAHARRNA